MGYWDLSPQRVSASISREAETNQYFCGKDFLIAGLRKLIYRGYDSSGIALLEEQSSGFKIVLQKSSGKLDRLEPLLEFLPNQAVAGIAHTRWATHGPPTTMNAHPHRIKGMALVHNGIIENSETLKKNLLKESPPPAFLSETDSEIALWSLHQSLRGYDSLQEGVLNFSKILKGSYTLALLAEKQPESIFLIKQGSPLVIGFTEEIAFLASDVSAIRSHCDRVLFLEDGDVGMLSHNVYTPLCGPSFDALLSLKSPPQSYADLPGLVTLPDQTDQDELGDAPHYMYKEIHEQPRVLMELLDRCVDSKAKAFSAQELGLSELDLSLITHIHVVGCGSAYYAGLVGGMALEAEARIPCRVCLASEYRYGFPIITPHTLVIAVSQSGETADTLACVQHAKASHAQVLAICNVEYSSLCRIATSTLMTQVGKEMGVASSKAFTAQVLSLYLVALEFTTIRGLPFPVHCFDEFPVLSILLNQTLDLEPKLLSIARELADSSSCLVIGRYTSAAIAYEGALKLKEITYIHAEGYSAGELKHGPLALVDSHSYLLALAPKDQHYPKMLSNIEEVCARGGKVIALITEPDPKLSSLCEHLIDLPALANPFLQSLSSTLVLQLIAYHVAVHLGHNVDQPRNLAKSVTVE